MEEKQTKKTALTNPMIFINRIKQWFKSKPPLKKALIILVGVGVLFALYIASVLVRYKDFPINGKTNTTEQSQSEKETFALPLKSGVVCAGLGNYSFQMDSPSSPIAESDKALILQTKNGLLLISKGEIKIENILKEQGIPFEKEGDTYVFSLSSKLGSEAPSGTRVSAMSIKKDDYTISLLYNLTDKERAEKTFKTVVSSIKGGCPGA